MLEYKVVKYHSGLKEIWNHFVDQAKNGTFLFKRDFMEYHKNRFLDASILIYQKEKLVGLFPANLDQNTVCSHQGLTYGGIVLSSKIKYQESLIIYQTILMYYENLGVKSLYLKEIPSFYCIAPNDELLHFLFLSKADLVRRDTTTVMALNGKTAMNSNRKRSIARGRKNVFSIVEEQSFKTFWQEVLIPNLSQKFQKKPVHSLEEITELKQNFPENIRQFNIYHKGEIVAGTTIFETKQVAHVQYISGIEDKNELGGLDVLFDTLIGQTFEHKPYFDFGISNEQEGQKVNKGLLYWKESYGARVVTQDFYKVQTKNHRLLKQVLV